jgi:hypothetical protein
MEPLDIRRRNYKRARDARVALIRCGECHEYYETSVRQARCIRKGEARRLCRTCRTLEAAQNCTPDQTEAYVQWWLEESGIPHAELRALADAVGAFLPEKAHPIEPVLSPSRRLPSEEGNRSNGVADGTHVRIHISGNTQRISTNAA